MAPGVIIAWSGTRPASRVYRTPIVCGRNLLGTTDDGRISRDHARLSWHDGRFTIEDLGGANGTYVDGHRIAGSTSCDDYAVVRMGRTIAVVMSDVTPLEAAPRGSSVRHGVVAGRASMVVHDALASAASERHHVVLRGDPGSGRGALAHAYAALLPGMIHRIEEDRGFDPEAVIELIDAAASSTSCCIILTQNPARPFAPQLAEFLDDHARAVDVPPLRQRPDELAGILETAVRSAHPGVTCHATVLEHALLSLRALGTVVADAYRAATYMSPGSTMSPADIEKRVPNMSVAIQGFEHVGRRRS